MVVFGFYFTSVFTLQLQVVHRKCLLECEFSLSVSLRHTLTHSRALPLADEWKFPLKRSVAPREWGGGGRGEGFAASKPLQAFWNIGNRSV